MYKLKQALRRGSALVGAVGLLAGIGSSALPALASADALNPLTERSLTLSSSSPGWAFTDGSGNSTYAGPNTGTNGQKTGNTFSFRVSSTKAISAFTFQYCTKPAGQCIAPGNNSPLTANNDATGASGTSDLDIVTSSPSEVTGTDYATLSSDTTATGTATTGSGTTADYGQVKQVPDAGDAAPVNNPANNITGNFVVLTGPSATGYVNTYSGGWSMAASTAEEATGTGHDNVITLTNSAPVSLNAGDYVKIIFFANDSNYITNPGSGAFFVKINDYASTDYQNWADGWPLTTNSCDSTGAWVGAGTGTAKCPENVVDGGVTVANVMNESIAIQTKVLETMDFSVGTVDPDTLSPTELAAATADYTSPLTTHGPCDGILQSLTPTDPTNVLKMGDQNSENSLTTADTFATHSYWRLSSNSSGGATVYYAGNTLSNTEGDEIAAIGATAAAPHAGEPQFGLALDNGTAATDYAVNYAYAGLNGSSVALEYGADQSAATQGAALDSTASTGWVAYQAANTTTVHNPQLSPLVPTTNYGGGTTSTSPTPANPGIIDSGTAFAFDPTSQTVPTAIASESNQVVDCVTGKMRYIANIAATTPAGIYTTKINYIAAPQY